jgi:NAD(P)-dependent dehydrogenase (short-subunit alcohol dehydrogenase family)
MNIIVVGGGGNPGRFGRDFCDKARLDGHSVYVVSHKDYNTNDPQQISADFNNPSAVVDAFNTVTQHLNQLDILLYNSSAGGYPQQASDYKSNSTVLIQQHYLNYNLYVLYPHLLSVEALKKMDNTSKIIFLTTGLTTSWMWEDESMDFNRLAGYIGGKSFQNHLMRGLATYNDKGVTVTSLSPHFDYQNADTYNRGLRSTYLRIMNITPNDNGKIRPVYNQ